MNTFTGLPGYKSDITSTNISRDTAHEIGQYFPNGVDISILASPDFNEIMSANQPWGDKLGIAVNNFAVNTIGMGAMWTSTLFDIPGMINEVKGIENNYTNDLYDWGKQFMTDNLKTIYERNPDEIGIGDWGWWFNRLGDTGSAMGIAVPTMLEAAGVAALTGGLGEAAEVANLARRFATVGKFISKATKLDKLAEVGQLGNLERITGVISKSNLARTAHAATYSYAGAREAHLQAKNEFDTVYDSQIQAGVDEQTARMNAAAAASFSFRANAIPKMFLGVLQSRIMTYSPLTGLSANSAIDKAFDNIKNPFLRGLARTGAEAGIEGGEEFVQNLIDSYATFKADVKSNLTNVYEGDKYIDNTKLFNDFFVGAISGGGMLGIHEGGKQILTKFGIIPENPYERAYSDMEKKGMGITLENMKDMEDAIRTGDTEKIKSIQRMANTNHAISSLWLDHIHGGEEKLFGSYIQYLNNIIRAIDNKDQETLSKAHISEDTDTNALKDNFLKFKDDALMIRESFLEEAEHASIHTVIDMTMLNVEIKNNERKINDLNNQIASFLPKRLNDFKGNGKSKFDNVTEKRAIKYAIKAIQELKIKKNLSNTEIESYDARIKELNDRLLSIDENLNSITEDNKEDATHNSNLIENNAPLINEYTKLLSRKIFDEKVKETMTEELNRWRKKSFQKERVKEMFSNNINRAKSKIDTKDIRKQVEQEIEDKNITQSEGEQLLKEIDSKESELPPTPLKTTLTTKEQAIDYDNIASKVGILESETKALKNVFDLSKDITADDIDVSDSVYNFIKSLKESDDKYPNDHKKFNKTNVESMANAVLDIVKRAGTIPSIYLALEKLSMMGRPKMENIFHAFRIGWDENVERGLLPAVNNWQELYEEYFAMQDAYEALNRAQLAEPIEEFEKKKVERKLIEEEIYGQSNNPGDGIAFTNGKRKELLTITNEDGSISRKWVPVESSKFFESEYAPKSKYLANPYEYNVGTKLIAAIPKNYKSIPHKVRFDDPNDPLRYGIGKKVTSFIKEDGKEITGIPTFGDYMEGITIHYEDPITKEVVSEYVKIEEDSDEYWDNVTISLFKEGGTAEKDAVGYIHTRSWYTTKEVRATNAARESANKNNALNRDTARKALQEGKTPKFEITYRGKGDYSQTRLEESVPLSEVSPTSLLMINFKSGGLQVLQEGKNFRSFVPFFSLNKVIDSKEFTPSNITDLRLTNIIKNGENITEVYTPFYLEPTPLTDQEVSSIVNAIYTYINPDENKHVRNGVKGAGIDINFESYEGLRRYVRMFVNFGHEEGHINLPKGSNEVILKNPTTGEIISYTKNSKINRQEIYDVVNAERNRRKVDADSIVHRANVFFVDEEGKVTKTDMDYDSYIRTKLLTNQLSLNVGTEENPFFSPAIQPVLIIEPENKFKAKDVEIFKEPITKQTVIETVEEEPISPIAAIEELKREDKDVIKLATEVITFLSDIISNDEKRAFNIDTLYKNYNDYSIDINSEIIEEFRKSENLIDYLLSTEQEELIESLFYQVNKYLPKVSEKRNKNDVQEIIAAFVINNIGKLSIDIDNYINAVKLIPEDYNKEDLLADLELANNKIESIKNNIALITDLVYDKLIEFDADVISDVDSLESESYDRGHNEVSMKEQASAAMRQFMSSLYDLDEKGNVKSGFLRLTKFVDQSIAFNDMTSIMADLESESDFKKAIEYLKDYRYAYPWIWYEPEGDDVIDEKKDDNKTVENKRANVLDKQSKTFIGRLLSTTQEDGRMSNIQHQFMYLMIKHNVESSLIIPRINDDDVQLRRYNVQTTTATRSVLDDWHNNLKVQGILYYDNREYRVDKTIAKELLDEYKELFKAIPDIQEITDKELEEQFKTPGNLFNKSIYTKGEINFSNILKSDNRFLKKLREEFKKANSNKILLKFKTKQYVIEDKGNDVIDVIPYDKVYGVSDEDISEWTKKTGIYLSPKHINELRRGITKFDKVKGSKAKSQSFYLADMLDYNTSKTTDGGTKGTSTGILGHIALQLAKAVESDNSLSFGTDKDLTFADNIFMEAAYRESKYSRHTVVTSYRDGNKSLYAYTAPNFMTDRVNRLKSGRDIRMLERNTFSKDSYTLDLLKKHPEFKNIFSSEMLPKTVIKQYGKKVFGDNSITKISEADHELTKLGHFQDMTRKMFRTIIESSGKTIDMRVASFFGLTMSDKQAMEVFNTVALNLYSKDFAYEIRGDIRVGDHIINFVYDQLVKPEINRIVEYSTRRYTIKGYKGNMFYLIPVLNKLAVDDSDIITKLTSIKDVNELHSIESQIKPIIIEKLKEIINNNIKQKIEVWKNLGIISEITVNRVKKDRFLFDKKYSEKFEDLKSLSTDKFLYAVAADFEINNMLHNSEMYKLFSGDPALYHKIDTVEVKNKFNKSFNEMTEADFIEASKQTFINIGKRLALLQAPGYKLSDTADEKYIQLMLDDNESTAASYEYIKTTYGEKIAENFLKANETDAQEYTTWQEHLHILERMGRMPDSDIEITPDEIKKVRHILNKGVKKYEDLKYEEKQLIHKVFQPMKPVYTGQYFDEANGVVRTVYIKSSSFPLLELLTHNLEIDKLRVLMEKIQKPVEEGGRGMYVRASYQSANKVGAVDKPLKIISDGPEYRMIDYSNNIDKVVNDHSITLDRSNFRIQQDIPYKSAKGKQEITQGTQLAKELYGDGVLLLKGFKDDKTGIQMWNEYQDIYRKIMSNKIELLTSKFGSIKDVQELLYEEALSRGYTKQTRHYLELDEDTGEFKNPIIFSPDAYKLENLLQAIINKHIVKIKMPGYSFVVGSEAGIMTKVIDELRNDVISDIVWVDKPLTRKLHYNEILIPNKIVDPSTGKLIDLLSDTKDGKPYAYQVKDTDTGMLHWKLNKDLIDESLLKVVSFRIPTSKHSSMSLDNIVGFLPVESGDLMIVSSAKTIMKGLDFDVDKENMYGFWTGEENGKIVPLHKQYTLENLNESISECKEEKERLLNSNDEEALSRIKSREKFLLKLKQKVLLNQLVENTINVLQHRQVAEKTMEVLSTQYAEDEANALYSILHKDSPYFTPLSSEYQKDKMIIGSSNKLGTGAYSLAVVFHSLAQQAKLSGSKSLKSTYDIQFGNFKVNNEFGGIKSLDGDRSITEIVSERQNGAVDGEKLQILGKVNINSYTIGVDEVLVLLGIDKGDPIEYKGKTLTHTPFLFLSQPIIRDYVKEMSRIDSQIATFSMNKEKTVVGILEDKYGIKGLIKPDNELVNKMENLTNKNLFDQLINKPNSTFQAEVLNAFLLLKEIGNEIQTISTTMNVDSKGLGKSLFDTLALEKRLKDINNLKFVENATSLLRTKDGEFTAQGAIIAAALKMSINNWMHYFPYNSVFFNNMFDIMKDVLNPLYDKEISTEKKQAITNELKKFLFSYVRNNLFGSDNLYEERKRLFLDTRNNTSLPRYLKNIIDNKTHPIISNNKLIATGLLYKLQTNGSLSEMQYNNAIGKEFSETTLNSSIISLLTNRIELPNFNGKPYDTIQLAKDLVAYAYLQGGVQEAREFVKFIPYVYLDKIGFTNSMKNLYKYLFENNIVDFRDIIDNFILQFARHNPSMLSKLKEFRAHETKMEIASDTLSETNLRILKLKGKLPFANVTSGQTSEAVREYFEKGKYFAIYDKTLELEDDKYLILKANMQTKEFELLSQLGSGSVSEYDYQSNGLHDSVVRTERLNPDNIILDPNKVINIYSTTKNGYENLSNLLNGPITIVSNNKVLTFKTVEHLYQSRKALFFNDTETANKIYKSITGFNAQKLGREVKGFNEEVWNEVAYQELEDAMRFAFEQNKEIRDLLLSTDKATLTHTSSNDKVKLGRWEKDFPEILMKIRSELQVGKELSNVEEFKGEWKREDVEKQPDKLFVFDDNTNDRLNTHYIPSTTQAVIRGLPNAIGIDTKKDRGTLPSSYFSDADFNTFKERVDEVIAILRKTNKPIVLPKDGIGTGKAKLQEKAPKLYQYLQQELYKLQFNAFDEPVRELSTRHIEVENIKSLNVLPEVSKNIKFEEDQTFGYRERTIKNASADVTIAIATDFNTAGEKLTKNSVLGQKKKYIAIDANRLEVTKERIDKIVESLNSVNAKTLNIAGNGIYTMKDKYTQEQVDKFTYQLLKAVIESPNLKVKIASIRTGGQTGFDEAGAKAGMKLGIPTKILAPKGWKFRVDKKRYDDEYKALNVNAKINTDDSVDISDEKTFKARFGNSVNTQSNLDKKSYMEIASSGNIIDMFDKFIGDDRISNGKKELIKKFKEIESQYKLIGKFIVDNTTEDSYYNRMTQTLGLPSSLFFNKNFNEGLDISVPDSIARKLCHEYMHALTTKEIRNYITDTAFPTIKDDMPQHIKDLVEVFLEARKLVSDDVIRSIDQKIRRKNAGERKINLTKEELDNYGLYSISEFVAELPTNKEFMNKLNEKPKEAKTFKEKFYKFFNSILEAFGIKINKGSLLDRGLAEISNLINNILVPEKVNKVNDTTNSDNDKEYLPDFQDDINELFNNNSELANIGTQEQYSTYLDTIFPNSKMKDIVYHGTNRKFDVFDKNKQMVGFGHSYLGKGFYFWKNKEYAIDYGNNIISVLLNITNSITDIDNLLNTIQATSFGEGQTWNKIGNDSIVNEEQGEIVVFEPEQIHILGSKQDIEGFKKFIENNKSYSSNENIFSNIENEINQLVSTWTDADGDPIC